MKNIIVIFSLLFASVLIGGCHSSGSKSQQGENMMDYARFIRVKQCDGYRMAEVVNPKDSNLVDETYILVPKTTSLPDSLPPGIVLRTPLSNLVIFSTVFAGALDELGELESIRGVVDAEYFSQPFIKDGIKNGRIVDLGSSSGPSGERLTSLSPDAILLSIYEGMDVKGIDKSGIPLIRMSDNLEADPLGRAEWIRFIGMLIGQEQKADSIFASVKKKYTRLKEQAKQYSSRPKVLTENMYQGVWYVPGGGSYQARIIEDAGGKYPWSTDKSTGSLSLSFEEVLHKGNDADIWLLKLYGKTLTREELIGMDSRYAYFKAVDRGGVYYADTQSTPLFEEFPYHPERLLQDYILIFHPETEGQLRYFMPMGK